MVFPASDPLARFDLNIRRILFLAEGHPVKASRGEGAPRRKLDQVRNCSGNDIEATFPVLSLASGRDRFKKSPGVGVGRGLEKVEDI